MSFANSERQRRWREKQKSLVVMGVPVSRKMLRPSYAGNTGGKLYQKMKVTGPRTAEFMDDPSEAVHDIQQSGGRKVCGDASRPVYVDGVQQRPVFHKKRATASRCDEVITEPLQAMRELNPTLNEMIRSTDDMNRVLCETANKPLNKRRMMASTAVAMHDAHIQRLKAHMSDSIYGYNPMRTLEQASPMSTEEVAAHS